MRKKLECKRCGSKLVYIRIKNGEIVCRSCGNIEKKDNKEE